MQEFSNEFEQYPWRQIHLSFLIKENYERLNNFF